MRVDFVAVIVAAVVELGLVFELDFADSVIVVPVEPVDSVAVDFVLADSVIVDFGFLVEFDFQKSTIFFSISNFAPKSIQK